MAGQRTFKDRLRETTEKLKQSITVTDPYEKKLNDLVLRATSDMWITPDWSINMDLVDEINRNQGNGTYEKVLRCIRRRLGHRDPKVQLFTLTLLETCAKNCGASFQSALSESDVWTDVAALPEPRRRHDLEVVDKALVMVEDFARTLRPHKFQKAYVELQASGVRFPDRPEEEVGAGMAAASAEDEGMGDMSEADRAAVQAALRDLEQTEQRRSSTGGPTPTPAPVPAQETVSAEDIAKIKEDLGTAKNSVDLLKDTLNSIPAEEPGQVEQTFIKELADQCNAMRPRLGILVQQPDVEETVMMEALTLYEALDVTLTRFDELVARASAGAMADQQLPNSTPAPAPQNVEADLLGRLDLEDEQPTLVSHRRGTSHAQPPSPQPTQPTVDLLGDFDAPTPPGPAATEQDAFAELAAAKNSTEDEFAALASARDGQGGPAVSTSVPTSPVVEHTQSPPPLSPPPPSSTQEQSQAGGTKNVEMDLISF